MPLTDNYIFQVDDNVTRKPVSYKSRFGITIAADLYLPKDLDESVEHAAIIVGAPYGGVKEQGPGVYAQNMAVPPIVMYHHHHHRLYSEGFRNSLIEEQRNDLLDARAEQRYADFEGAEAPRHRELGDRVRVVAPFDKLAEFFTREPGVAPEGPCRGSRRL